jgi:hypothetical protein
MMNHDIESEQLPLLEQNVQKKGSRSRTVAAAMIVSAGAVLFLGAFTMNLSSASSPMMEVDSDITSSFESLRSVNMKTFAATNYEIQTYGPSGADYPWMDGLLVEPYSATTFYAKAEGDWTLAGDKLSADDVTTASSAKNFNFEFKSVGEYTITFENAATSTSETVNVYVKYVRREIRALSAERLTRFRAAFKTIIEIKDEVTGKKLYGDTFTPFSKLCALHANWVSI